DASFLQITDGRVDTGIWGLAATTGRRSKSQVFCVHPVVPLDWRGDTPVTLWLGTEMADHCPSPESVEEQWASAALPRAGRVATLHDLFADEYRSAVSSAEKRFHVTSAAGAPVMLLERDYVSARASASAKLAIFFASLIGAWLVAALWTFEW